MRLSYLNIIEARSCGGLLDGLKIDFGDRRDSNSPIAPLCLIGPNGSGKSQLIQLIAEIFQLAWHEHNPKIERDAANEDTLFRLDYFIRPPGEADWEKVRLSRGKKGKKFDFTVARWTGDEYEMLDWSASATSRLLPSFIVGYSSGDNETLSLPFLISRSGYAADVATAALYPDSLIDTVLLNKLLMVDYASHLEVLVATQLLGEPEIRRKTIEHACLDQITSFRCTVRLNGPATTRIKLTDELERHILGLKRTATCWDYVASTDTYTFDFFVSEATRTAASHFFVDALTLYIAIRALGMLNDLAIPKAARTRIKKSAKERRYATRLPEPQDEQKVFQFERVRFQAAKADQKLEVDYVSLSDGEHQQAQIFGILGIVRSQSALFLLDEPESHLNPRWRVKFVSSVLDLLPDRKDQEVLITSHAPFVPSDMDREQVLIFRKDEDGKIEVKNPDVQTFGATYDTILESCFGVEPPISKLAMSTIDELMKTDDIELIRNELKNLGPSVEKSLLADRLRRMIKDVPG
ncbi:restriction system-associated AAA family ATPase [Oceanicaulis sp. LC35]|uniref:restriction system-associated AAA family ATPase n=1 Tax=Oceanicaulis sp. LC35 TaxID=3349635 RepID=UPI003F843102